MDSTIPQVTITNRFLGAVRERLAGKGFLSEDFSIYQGTINDGFALTIDIIYKYNNVYFYKAKMEESNSGSDTYFTIKYSPGEIKSMDTKIDLKSDEYLDGIDDWILSLREELRSTTLGRQIHENELKLDELERFVHEKFSESGPSYFSETEGEELKEKLNEFEKLFKEHIENISERNKLHEEVELLKEQIHYLSKAKWTTSIASKIMNWGIRNPKATRQLGLVAIRAILPQEIENSLPPGLLAPLEDESK